MVNLALRFQTAPYSRRHRAVTTLMGKSPPGLPTPTATTTPRLPDDLARVIYESFDLLSLEDFPTTRASAVTAASAAPAFFASDFGETAP